MCWLCPRCHAFESKEMLAHQAVQVNNNEVSSENDDNYVTNDDGHANEELNEGAEEEEKEEDNAQMDSDFMNQSKEIDHDSLDMDEEGAVSYDHEYRKSKTVEQLSVVLELLKIEAIHDKYVANFPLIF